MSRLAELIRRRLSLALLPLSVVPFVAVAPAIVRSHDHLQRKLAGTPLPAPAATLSAAERSRFRPFRAPRDEVPVLVWHGIDDRKDHYSTTRAQLARQLALLARLGYTAISMRRWQDFRAGRGPALPRKPILLTFDDGRLDSYRGADATLARNHMRAAMFVITGDVDARNPFYLTWSELHKMEDSGRWDVEPHADQGHRQITIAPGGRQAGFYAARRYTRSGGRESLAGWESRVDTDIFALRDRFAAQGFTPHAFAVPFGDYGQRARNDPAIPGLLSGLLTRQFGSFFIQSDDDDPGFTRPGRGVAQRYEVRSDTTLHQLYRWLRRHAMQDDHHHPTTKR